MTDYFCILAVPSFALPHIPNFTLLQLIITFFPRYMLPTEVLEFCFVLLFFSHVPSVATILNVSLGENHFGIFNIDNTSHIFFTSIETVYIICEEKEILFCLVIVTCNFLWTPYFSTAQ